MGDREQYDLLVKESNAEYAAAGVALRDDDHAEYRRRVDAAWAAMDKAKPFFDRLPRDEQITIMANAYTETATAFVRGLTGRSGN